MARNSARPASGIRCASQSALRRIEEHRERERLRRELEDLDFESGRRNEPD